MRFRARKDDWKSYVARVGIIRESACCRLCRARHKRHTFGSLLIQAGAPLTYVCDQMGHSSVKITVDIYGHLIPSADIRFMDAVGSSKSEPSAKTSPAKNATPAQPGEEPNRTNLEQVLQNHGVGDGVRTRDVQIHSLALYQLSYTHRSGVRRRKQQYSFCNIRRRRVSTEVWPKSELQR